MDTQNERHVEIFVPASDADLETMAAEDLLVPYQAGGIVLSQVFRECRGVEPLAPVSRGSRKGRRHG